MGQNRTGFAIPTTAARGATGGWISSAATAASRVVLNALYPGALQQDSAYDYIQYPGYYLPEEGWHDTAKIIIADVLSSVGGVEYERGVFDRAQPSIPDILYPPIPSGPAEVPDWKSEPGAQPWPGDTTGPGWNDDEWVYPEAEVAIDWGGIITGLGSQYIQTQYGPNQFAGNVGGPTGITWGTPLVDPVVQNGSAPPVVTNNALCPPSGSCGGPRYLTYDCKTGQMSVRRRRRRRRLLTEGDKSDLGVIVAMFGKGAAAQIALAAAVKR